MIGDDNEQSTQIFQEFILLSTSQSGLINIGICTAATSVPEENGKYYIDLFQKQFGVQNVSWIPITIDHKSLSNSSSMIKLVDSFTGIFFGGGDQLQLYNTFENSQVLNLMQQKVKLNQLAAGGTSAGCAILQKTPMVTGGESYQGIINGASDSINPLFPDNLSYLKQGGFGFFEYGYLDTHFGQRGREGRQIQLVGQLFKSGVSDVKIGFGMNELAALKVVDNELTVIGESGVYLIDMNQAQQGKDIYWSNVIVNYLTVGDKVILTNQGQNYSITQASYKQNIQGNQTYDQPMAPSHDIFSSLEDYDEDYGRKYPNEFTIVSLNLYDSYGSNTYGLSFENNPTIQVNFKKKGHGYVGNYLGKQIISYVGMIVDIISQTNQTDNLNNTQINLIQ